MGAGWLGEGCARVGPEHGERGGSRTQNWVGGRAGGMNSGYNGGPPPGAVGGFGGGGGGSEDNRDLKHQKRGMPPTVIVRREVLGKT